MQIEEDVDYHKVHQIETTSKESEKEKDKGNSPGLKRADRFRENRYPHFNSYTPLTIPRRRILDEALQAELIPTLKQSQTLRNVDTSKHCQYHRNYDHTTEGCQALKDKVEELIQAGHFQKISKEMT